MQTSVYILFIFKLFIKKFLFHYVSLCQSKLCMASKSPIEQTLNTKRNASKRPQISIDLNFDKRRSLETVEVVYTKSGTATVVICIPICDGCKTNRHPVRPTVPLIESNPETINK